MVKIWLSLVLVYLLVFTAAPVLAGSKMEKQAQSIEQVKAKVAELGVGGKSRATVRLKNGTKLKGYIYEVGEQEFVLRDKDTGAPIKVLYRDVAKVEASKGHSTAKAVALGVAAGAGVVLTIILIAFTQLD